ncbi:hypothetical protein NPIL_118821 [Nephila pilipes]|uniref:Uncharacterized protein n=1 Tax=Nephila pilipes TaxID=299642 RepID=A0A8X6NWE1_NEPPI|nr:hypothetical protein NPIL_118821 [Nephila pilipes]
MMRQSSILLRLICPFRVQELFKGSIKNFGVLFWVRTDNQTKWLLSSRFNLMIVHRETKSVNMLMNSVLKTETIMTISSKDIHHKSVARA